MTDAEVRQWAWKQVALGNEPSEEILELATEGPMTCLKRCWADFNPRPAEMSYEQEFALRAVRTNLESAQSTLHLFLWAAKRAMGEDLEDQLVQLAYRWDHLLNDCQDTESTLDLARRELPLHMERCQRLCSPFSASGA
jgi:hypothetical protein